MPFTETILSQKKVREFVKNLTKKENEILGYELIRLDFITDEGPYSAFHYNNEKEEYVRVSLRLDSKYTTVLNKILLKDLNEEILTKTILVGIESNRKAIIQPLQEKFLEIEEEYLEHKKRFEEFKAL